MVIGLRSHENAVQANRISVDGKLVFNRYGEFYFLSQVWTPGEEIGRKLSSPVPRKKWLQELNELKRLF